MSVFGVKSLRKEVKKKLHFSSEGTKNAMKPD
jgi:hypothetical protein